MRLRPTLILSTVAIATLALAGCSGSGEEEPDATSTETPAAVDLCDAGVGPGEASDAVTVEGETGEASKATFDLPLEIADLESTVVTEGEGEAIETGELISYAMSAFDAESGEEIGTLGYNAYELLPQPVTAESVFGQILGCATVGSRVVTTFPPTQAQDGSAVPGQVYVFDLLDNSTPTAAWGEEQPPVDGMPTVELAEDGAPTITLPEGLETPAETQLAPLKAGDGETVAAGDSVLVQYTGVKLSDGSVFDSSWENGAPVGLATDQVVPGFTKALEGQKVGSQVLAVIPPAEGYGEDAPTDDNPLGGETLVFVVDILATQHAAAPAQ